MVIARLLWEIIRYLKKCFGDDYRYTMFEMAILHYHRCIEKMKDWIKNNYKEEVWGILM